MIITIWILSFLLLGSIVNNQILIYKNRDLKRDVGVYKGLYNGTCDVHLRALNTVHEKVNKVLLKLN